MNRKNEGWPAGAEGLRGGDGKGGGLTIQLDIDLLFGQLGESTRQPRRSRSLINHSGPLFFFIFLYHSNRSRITLQLLGYQFMKDEIV